MVKKETGLGVTNDLNEIDIDELINNKTAINMLLHHNKKMENENLMLKQDLNRQATIERTLSNKKTYTKIATIISIFATILISFGINFLTTNSKDIKGLILIILGVFAEGIYVYFSFKGDGD